MEMKRVNAGKLRAIGYDSRERLGFPMAPREWVANLQKKAA